MRRADISRALTVLLALWLGGCASRPDAQPEPRPRLQASGAEADGAARHAQGEYPAAARHFALALRLHQSLDDEAGAARNRLQLAQTQLAQGAAQSALEQAEQAEQQTQESRLPALLLQAQARLALNQGDAAQTLLDRAQALCAGACAERGRLLLLRARLAWVGGDAVATVEHGGAALPLLREQGEEREIANAWRLRAAAQLHLGDSAAALASAQAALEIDRRLALPEKIARDWLLIGDIQRRVAPAQARPAYARARTVAAAAGLPELVHMAERSLQENVR